MSKSEILHFIILYVLFSIITISAQARELRPRWITESLKSKNGTIEYKVVSIDNFSSLVNARKDVVSEIAQFVENTYKVILKSDNEIVWKQASDNSTLDNEELSFYNLRTIIEGDEVNISVKIIDEYIDKTGQMSIYYALCAVSNPYKRNVKFENVKMTEYYGASALWRSAIGPGWGQFYKGQPIKGSIVIAATATTIASIVVCENMRADYYKKMYEQHKFASQYNALANSWETARNISIAAAVAVYAYNLIDAVAAKGMRRAIISDNYRAFKIYPSIGYEYGGLALQYNF